MEHMGSISNATAIHGLTASGATTSTNVTGSLTLGLNQTSETLTGADVFYSLKITSTGAGDLATIDLTDGTAAQTIGTPTITDGDGNDFEGETLSTLVSISAFHVVFDDVASGTITMDPQDTILPDVIASVDGTVASVIVPASKTLSGDGVAVTFSAASQTATFIIAGKTT